MKSENFPSAVVGRVLLALTLLLPAGWAAPLLQAQGASGSGIRTAVQSEVSYFGITMEDVTSQNMASHKLKVERGVIVRSVEPGSPAAAAKLQENDVILEFGGFPAWSAEQFAGLVRQTPPGRKVNVAVSRDGIGINLLVELGKQTGPLRWDGSDGSSIPGSDREEFSLDGPNGRTFRFNIPGGRMFGFEAPNEQQPKQRLGVTLQPLTDQMAEFLGVPGKRGALVVSIEAGSPASGKIKAGDVIIKADGQAVGQAEDLVRIVQQKTGTLQLQLVRGGKEISVTVDLSRDTGNPGRGYTM